MLHLNKAYLHLADINVDDDSKINKNNFKHFNDTRQLKYYYNKRAYLYLISFIKI